MVELSDLKRLVVDPFLKCFFFLLSIFSDCAGLENVDFFNGFGRVDCGGFIGEFGDCGS